MATYLKAKALFLVLLLAGHEAVRVKETIRLHDSIFNPGRESAEEMWQTENEACAWSTLDGGCTGPGCRYRYLPYDAPVPLSSESCRLTDEYMLETDRAKYFQLQAKLLAAKSAKFAAKCKNANALNLKCHRRAKHVYRAMKFLSKAQDSSLIGSLSADQKDADRALFQESLDHMAGMAGKDGALVMKLTEKMKARRGAVKEDPLGSVQNVVKLLTMLLKGSAAEKEQARTEINEMEVPSETGHDEPLQEEQVNDLVTKLEQGAHDLIDNVDNAGSELDSESDGNAVSTKGTSMIEFNASLATRENDVTVVKGIAFIVIVLLVVVAIIWAVIEIVAVLVVWALFSLIGCGAYALGHNNAVEKGTSNGAKVGFVDSVKCIGSVFAMPFVYAYKGGRWVYRLFAGKKNDGQNDAQAARR